MSKYTTEVRYICEKAAGLDESKGYADVDTIIENSIDSIFSFNFPMFDESYRSVLCTKILRHYYTREIGFETVGLWKLKLQTKLNEIMPYYNQLYNSELIKFNPLYDVDLNTTHVGDKSGESSKEENKIGVGVVEGERSESGTNKASTDSVEGENRSGTSKSDQTGTSIGNDKTSKTVADNENSSGVNYDLYSDTPQGALAGVNSEEYLTSARKITDSKNKNAVGTESGNTETNRINNDNIRNSYDEENQKTNVVNENRETANSSTDKTNRNDIENMSGKDKFNSTESYVLHVVGKQAGASYSKLLKEFRETFLNIDMDIINDLSPLFLNLW